MPTFCFLALTFLTAGSHAVSGLTTQIRDAGNDVTTSGAPAKIETVEPATTTEIASTAQTASTTSSTSVKTTTKATQTAAATPSGNYLSFNGHTVNFVDTATTSSTPSNAAAHYTGSGGKFYFGHNTSSIFGSLASLRVGSAITISQNGSTQTYHVSNIQYYAKSGTIAQGNTTLSGINMNQVARANDGSTTHAIALMTCAGTSYGNGDASQRLVVYAD